MGKWLPLAFWAGVIFLTSCFFIPSRSFVQTVATHAVLGQPISEGGFAAFWKSWWWVFVKGYHVMEFFLLTLFARRAFGDRLVYWSILFVFLFACSDEYHQTFVKGRGGKWTDVAIDCIGIILASLLLLLRSQARRKRVTV